MRAELDIPVMHDDQHGTATVVLAGLINALKLRKISKEKVKIIIKNKHMAKAKSNKKKATKVETKAETTEVKPQKTSSQSNPNSW